MTGFIPKNQRRFPIIGVISIAAYILILCIGTVISAIGATIATTAEMGAIGLFAGIIGSIIGAVINIIFTSFLYISIAILISIKIHHWAQIFPGVIGLIVAAIGLPLSAITFLVGLFAKTVGVEQKLVGLTYLSSIVGIIGTAITALGWASYILLVILATKRNGNKPAILNLLKFVPSIIFVSNIFSSLFSILMEIAYLINGYETLGMAVVTIITAFISIGASVVGAIAFVAICSWFVNPAKKGYVPDLEAPVEEAHAEETCIEALIEDALTEEAPVEAPAEE